MAQPELRVFGESNLDREVRRFFELIALDNPNGILALRVLQKANDPEYVAAFGLSFLEGVMAGGGERLRVWERDLESSVRGLVRFVRRDGLLMLPIGTMVGLYEFFRTAFDPEVPAGISPEVARAVDRLAIIHDYQPIFVMLDVLNDKYRTKSLLELFNMTGDAIWESLRTAATSWVNSLLAATGDAEKQGRILGTFIGEAVVELVRAFVEPPALSVFELASLFDLGDDEIRQLAPAPTP